MKTKLTDTIRGQLGARTVLFLAALVLVLAAGTASLAQSPEVGGNQNSGDFDYSKIDLRVGVWLNKETDEVYQRGEEMGAGFQTNTDAYAVVYRIDVDGLVTVLWPRSRMDNGFAFGGHEYLLPVAGARKLNVSASEGEGYVEAIVSKYPFDLRDLNIDFHHEMGSERYNFRVAGDPFLAMNEVNFAVTGLENSEEYVITNYTGYYVHREVEHPRYLCNQCHFEDDLAYEPYSDSCTLEITYDYGWSNGWYEDYGYFPVYANPVYVYVDPWTWRPWVNFWYYPSYVCAPYYGYGWYGGGCYSWGHSPYYGGNCNTAYNNGYARYRPLTPGGVGSGSGSKTKTREYGAVSRMVSSDTPDSRQRDAMTNRMRVSDLDGVKGRSSNLTTTGARAGGYSSVKATSRERPSMDTASRTRGNSGLRIRGGADTPNRTRSVDRNSSGSDLRHRAGGPTGRSGLVPVSRGSGSSNVMRGSSGRTSGGAVDMPKGGGRSNSSTGQRSIKPVEPRQKGTRVWNSGRSGQSSDRNDRTRSVRPGSKSSRSSSGDRSRSGGSVKPGSSRKGSSPGSRNSSGSVKSRSGSKKSSVKSSSKSSGSKSSVGNNKSSSGGSRSSGGSSGGGRSSGGSRSGGGSRGGGSRGGTSGRR